VKRLTDPDAQSIFRQVCDLVEPFNRNKVPLTEETTFSADLELDSLAVMDFVAAVEDHFDITVPLNLLPDLETIGQVASAVEKIIKGDNSGSV